MEVWATENNLEHQSHLGPCMVMIKTSNNIKKNNMDGRIHNTTWTKRRFLKQKIYFGNYGFDEL